jgi:hypothetical protein
MFTLKNLELSQSNDALANLQYNPPESMVAKCLNVSFLGVGLA